MYSLVVSKLQRSLELVLKGAPSTDQASLDKKRNAFLVLFALYRSLEVFITKLEKAVAELESLANGGGVVKTVIQNKLENVKQSAGYLGNNICGPLPNRAGFVSMAETDQHEGALREMGLYRFPLASPLRGPAKSNGMSHSFRELCPYVATDGGKASYDIVYTLAEPTLTAAKLYDGIDYDAVPFMEMPKHVANCISKNIEKQLSTYRVEMRNPEELAEFLRGNRNDVVIMNQRKKELADRIRNSFTIERML